MNFNTLVKTEINPILTRSNFDLIDEIRNFLLYSTSEIQIAISYNEKENVGMLCAGLHHADVIELDGDIIGHFFNTESDRSQMHTEKTMFDFVSNLKVFLLGSGKSLLVDTALVQKIHKFSRDRNKEYTQQILETQTYQMADEAWEKHDYQTFIDTLNKLGIQRLSKVYFTKYRYALKKFSN